MIDVIPAPARVEPGPGRLRLVPGARIACDDPALDALVGRFRAEVARRTGLRLAAADDGDDAAIFVQRAADAALEALPAPIGLSPAEAAPDERHVMTVAADGVIVRAPQAAGVARALSTLVQLIATRAGDAVELPAVRILDGPRFAWRGLSLDVARADFTVGELERVVDLAALYKLGVLHLHLTDDQAWRIAAGRPPRHAEPDGTFFSDGDLRALVAYAQERFITLLPEIDTPGHCAAIIAMRPELDSGRNVRSFDVGGHTEHGAWLDPDHPGTLALVDDVYARVAAIFPGRFLHIGGDETFGMPDDAYERFERHVQARVGALGRRTIGWQETMRAGAGAGHVIQHWISSPQLAAAEPPGDVVAQNVSRSRTDVERAIEQGVPIVVSPQRNAYLDVPYAEPSSDPGQEERRARLGLRGYERRTVADAFDWDPAAAIGPGHVAGVEAAIWCETVETLDDLAFLLLPRLAGIATRAWSEPAATWRDHRRSLAAHAQLWEQDGLAFFASSQVDWPAR